MQHSSKLLLSLCLCILLVTGCRKDSEDNPVNPGTNKPTVLTTIAGIVSDENGNALSGITVSTHGKTAVSNHYGLFVVKDVRVPQDRCFILARRDGYFTASRAEVPKANGVTNMRLSMMTNPANYSVSASAGGTVNISGGGIVEFPANGFSTESGQPYTGTVKVAARWLNPPSKAFYNFFPGDFTATRTDGSETLLYSYGVLNVELYSTTGAKVKMATGKQATLKYPIPSSMLSGAPSEMPLWYFDEGIGMWKEEGKAVKQGSFYVGEVTHFTPWNCDMPMPTAVVKGHVRCDNNNVSNIRVQAGQREVITDENGYYEVRVPAGLEFNISVDAAKNLGTETVTPIPVGPLSDEQVFTQDVIVTPCPAYITGMLTDCNGDPVEGIVQVKSNIGFHYAIVLSGQFRVRVESSAQLLVYAAAYNGSVTDPLLIEPIASGTTKNIGNVQLCQEIATNYIDIPLDSGIYFNHLILSPDGSMVATIKNVEFQTIQIYDTQSGALLTSIVVPEVFYGTFTSLEFSHDNRKLMYSSIGGGSEDVFAAIIWSTDTGQEIARLTEPESPIFMSDGNSVLKIDSDTREIVQISILDGTEINRFFVTSGARKLCGLRANGTEVVYIEMPSDFSAKSVKYTIWNLNTNTLVRTITTEDLSTQDYLFQPFDNNHLGVSTGIGYEMILYIYDLSNGQQISEIPLKALSRGIPTMRPFSEQFVHHTNMMPVGLYNISDGSLVRFLPSPDNSLPFNAELACCADGSKVAAMWFHGSIQSSRCYLRIWNLP